MKKILVVDDEQEITEQIKTVLMESLDCTIDIAYNGKEAIDKMTEKEERYDLLIMALLIPKLNGMEVCQFMMRDEQLKDIPLLLISILPVESNAFEKSLKKFDELSMIKGALEKPFSDEEILTKVKSII